MRLPDHGVIERYFFPVASEHAVRQNVFLYRAATLSHIMHHVCMYARQPLVTPPLPAAACGGIPRSQNPLPACCLYLPRR